MSKKSFNVKNRNSLYREHDPVPDFIKYSQNKRINY